MFITVSFSDLKWLEVSITKILIVKVKGLNNFLPKTNRTTQ